MTTYGRVVPPARTSLAALVGSLLLVVLAIDDRRPKPASFRVVQTAIAPQWWSVADMRGSREEDTSEVTTAVDDRRPGGGRRAGH